MLELLSKILITITRNCWRCMTMPNTREKLIKTKLKDGAESICDKCFHGKVCRAIDKQACIECNHFFDANGVTIQSEPLTNCQQSVAYKWLATAERMPQEKGDVCKNVILFMDDGLVTVGWLNENTGKGYYLDASNDFIQRVPISRFTHWMPLPEPPKGE